MVKIHCLGMGPIQCSAAVNIQSLYGEPRKKKMCSVERRLFFKNVFLVFLPVIYEVVGWYDGPG